MADWDEIRIDYETNNTTYTKLATKYDLPLTTIATHSQKNEWRKHKAEKVTKAMVAIENKVIEQKQEILNKELLAADLIVDRCMQALMDEAQFNRWLVLKKEKTFDKGKPVAEVFTMEEQNFKKIDARALKDIAFTFEKAAEFKKDLLGVMTSYNHQKLEIDRMRIELEREKFEFEKAKLDGPSGPNNINTYVEALKGSVIDTWDDPFGVLLDDDET